MVVAQKFIIANKFEGKLKESDLSLVEEQIPPIEDGEFLVEAQFISVDPYMRSAAYTFQTGQTMIGAQVAKVIESKDDKFPVGAYVLGNYGWRTHTIIKNNPLNTSLDNYILPDLGNLPLSLALGVLGMPGNTAYFGLLDICQPKPGETVVVTAAGGAVGSHVGQIAKIKDCNVIGITGSDDKTEWLKSIGFDHVINYKTTSNLKEALNEVAPKGIDCYFDNVGGEISSIVINQMNLKGRIAVCGAISAYNDDDNLPKATIIQPGMVRSQLRMRGFLVTEFAERWFEGIQQNLQWIQEDKLKYRETVTEGFENMTKALINLLDGNNIGKAIVQISNGNVERISVDFKKLFNTFEKLGK